MLIHQFLNTKCRQANFLNFKYQLLNYERLHWNYIDVVSKYIIKNIDTSIF